MPDQNQVLPEAETPSFSIFPLSNMDDKDQKLEKQEMKIPVFTVLKNGVILKNIILNTPISNLDSESSEELGKDGEKSSQEGQKLLVGRHPDCNIVLDHPSISRFHLQICSKPLLQKISVIDLSSVHGTWISGQKIEPQVPVELEEGDILKLGVSTRTYRLQWVPLSAAFEIKNPIISLVNISEQKEEPVQDLSHPLVIKNPLSSSADMAEGEEEQYQDENFIPSGQKQDAKWSMPIPSAPPMPELVNSSLFEVSSADHDKTVEKENQKLEADPFFTTLSPSEGENRNLQKRALEQKDVSKQAEIMQPDLVHSPSKVITTNSKVEEDICVDHDTTVEKENQKLEAEPFFRTLTPLEGGNWNLEKRALEQKDVSKQAETMLPELVHSPSKVVTTNADVEEDIFSENKENRTPHFSHEVKSKKWNSDKNRRFKSESMLKKREERIPFQTLLENSISNSKSLLVPNATSSSSLFEVFSADHDTTVEKENQKVEAAPFFTTLSPLEGGNQNLQKRASEQKDVSKSAEIMLPELVHSPSKVITTNSDVEEDIFSENKENRTPPFSHEAKSKKWNSDKNRRFKPESMLKKREERTPFQTLLENFISNSKKPLLVPNATSSKNSNSFSHTNITDEKKCSGDQSVDQADHKLRDSKMKWNVVVDTSSLLNEESRRSLKLLEGLKGTHLIIPRMVIRELDCLKRSVGRFTKADEASSVLQWIEECMVKTRWWIHVQTSGEGMPIAPTPPVSPRSRLSGGSNEFGNSLPFSTCGSMMEIVSPTAEDHILECALLFKGIKNDGQVVLITNDTVLKIKAMAEGLICETAKEFRDSLANPYSERFLWAASTPIGPTWSCLDEVGLKENYHSFLPAQRTAKGNESAKGLKLILLHNSHYGQKGFCGQRALQ